MPSASARPAVVRRREDKYSYRLKQLLSEARELLEAKKISRRLMYDISGINDPPEDQIPVARALCEEWIDRQALHAALGGSSEGHRRKIIALCKSKVASKD